MLYLFMLIGIIMFSCSFGLLRNYIECIREKNKEPKVSSELTIFIILLTGVLIFSASCYFIGAN